MIGAQHQQLLTGMIFTRKKCENFERKLSFIISSIKVGIGILLQFVLHHDDKKILIHLL